MIIVVQYQEKIVGIQKDFHMKKYLGIDIGTTSLKAAVFDLHGNRLGLKKVDYTLETDSESGYIEFDAIKYVDMCKTVIDELCSECGEITALSVDTQGETIIFADENGTPLCPAIVWLDNRAEKEAEAIKESFGHKKVFDVTGQPEITAGWPASKLLWLKNNKPDVFTKTRKIFMLEDWIIYGLTGKFVTEPTIQSSSVYFDITSRTFWDEMLEFIGVDRCIFPEIVETGVKVGEYKGISVVSGTLDQIAGTIGVGVVDESLISEMTGTIMAICAMKSEMPQYDPSSIVPCHLHAIKDKYCMILWSSTAGMALKWFKQEFASDLSFAEIDELCAKISAGCDGMSMLPYFCGSTIPNYNPNATGVFAGVTLSHTRAHFARAILEAVAFMLKSDLDYLGPDSIKRIRITGGGASSPLWAQIKSDVTSKTLETVFESETACLGTAILAMVGDGEYTSIEEAASAVVKTKAAYTPSGIDYSDAYNKYTELDNKLNK